MQSASSRLLKNTLFLYIRQLFVLVIGLYTTRLTLQVLGVSDFGIFAAVAGVTSLLGILTKTLTSGTQRYITLELGRNNLYQLNKVYITSIHIHLLVSIIIVILGETIGNWFILTQMTLPTERMLVVLGVFQITLLNSVLAVINIPNVAEIVAHEDMGVTAIVAIIEAVLKLAAVISLFYISWDKLLLYSIVLFALQFLNRFFCVYYCRSHYKEVQYHFIWDSDLLKGMLKLSGWMGMVNMSVMGFVQGVNILLNIFFGPAMNAAYGVAMQAYSGIRSFCSNFQLASNPQIVKLYSKGELDRMQRLLFSVCKMSFFLIFSISLPFLVYSDYILQLWLGNVPDHAKTFFLLLVLYAYIDVMAYPLDIAAGSTGKIKWYSISISVLVLSILPMAYLAYYFGAIAEIIYIIAIVVSWLCLFVRISILSKLIKFKILKFIKLVVLRILFVALISAFIPIIFKLYVETNLLTVVIGFVLSYLLVSLVVFNIGLNNGERYIVVESLSSIKERIMNG